MVLENVIQQRNFHRVVQYIDNLLGHPLWRLFIGLFFIGSGVLSLAYEFGDDLHEFELRTHHGVLALGVLIMIRSLAEFLENFESGSEALDQVAPSLVRKIADGFFWLMHRKVVLLATAVFLFVAGFTDASEFFLVQDHHGTSSALMLWLCLVPALAYVVLGSSEAVEHLKPGQFRERLERVLSPQVQVVGAVVVLGLSIWEGVINAEEAVLPSTHHATFLWAANESVKNTIRSVRQLGRIRRAES